MESPNITSLYGVQQKGKESGRGGLVSGEALRLHVCKERRWTGGGCCGLLQDVDMKGNEAQRFAEISVALGTPVVL